VTAIEKWFDDLSIVNASGKRNANLPGLNRLLMSLQRPRPRDMKLEAYIKPIKNLQIPFWRTALNPNAPIPEAAILKAIDSIRTSILSGEFDGALKIKKDANSSDENRASLGRIYARMGLIKAHYNRSSNRKGDQLMTCAFDPNRTYPAAFHCGRLMRFFAEIQEEAIDGEINAGVVQRYYGAANRTPKLVLGRLAALCQQHLSKIEKQNPGLRFWFDSQIGEISCALDGNLPETLSLEGQTMFALGYYQQLAFNRTKRSKNPKVRPESSDSDDTSSDA
jgi:CRISPR-associated protein Csd1